MCASLRYSRSPPMTLVFKFWVPINKLSLVWLPSISQNKGFGARQGGVVLLSSQRCRLLKMVNDNHIVRDLSCKILQYRYVLYLHSQASIDKCKVTKQDGTDQIFCVLRLFLLHLISVLLHLVPTCCCSSQPTAIPYQALLGQRLRRV